VLLIVQTELGRRGLRQREAKPLYYIERANQGTGSVHKCQGDVNETRKMRIHRDECRQ